MDPVSPETARRTYRTVEPYHAFIYFEPASASEYAAIGLAERAGYFASRSAAMGAVGPEVVVATFYNFNPQLVYDAMAGAWEAATPEVVLAARLRVADAGLRRMLGDAVASDETARAAALARACAEAACTRPEGRPLFAGHADLPWPTEPHLVLWHAETLLREFRGDGHVAALVLDGCSGIEALVMHAATGEVDVRVLQSTRAWPVDRWDEAVEALAARGWITPGPPLALTGEGARRRAAVEETTDRLAVYPYSAIGEDGCQELRALARPFTKTIVGAWGAPTAPLR